MKSEEKDYPPLVIVAAMAKGNRAIGKDNRLLWHAPTDLKHFKTLTLGHPIIMGRKTFESIVAILGKPLPGRTTIVLTRDTNYRHPGVIVAHSLDEAISFAVAGNPQEIHIGGGAELYCQALPLVSKLHITWFFAEKEGDAFFPEFEDEFAVVTRHPPQEDNGLKFQWIDYERKRS